ncbi:MAG: ATP-binding cassette domain-containing protein [Spirochaetia bacterium]|nr:ATP-binding cassette domain-containing protein [Spirochaetia bacterium]
MIIQLENISLNINNFDILNSISLNVDSNETVVLLGKNGSGKTMLLKTVVGLYKPNEGYVKVFGHDINKIAKEEKNNIFRKTGYVFQKSGLFDSLTIAENVMFALQRFTNSSKSDMFEKAIELLKSTGLKNVENKFPSELSGGMQKRAGIARAIAMDPTMLLLDDPTAGLDPVLSDAIADLIIDIRERLKSAIIVVTHDMKIAYKLASKIGLLHEGRLINILPTEDFINSTDEFIRQFRTGSLEGPIPVLG